MSGEELSRRIALERNAATRLALGDVLREIDSLHGNEIYRRAWKKAALRVKAMLSVAETVNIRS